MKEKICNKINEIIFYLDRTVAYISIVLAFTSAYYINILNNVDLKSWDRTFCSAILSGISIEARIANFYKFIFIYMPVLTIVIACILIVLFKYRPIYKIYFQNLMPSIFLVSFVSYISRYTAEEELIQQNRLIQIIISFVIILCIEAILDKNQIISFDDITLQLCLHITIVILLDIYTAETMIKNDIYIYYIAISVLVILFGVHLFILTNIRGRYYRYIKNICFIILWIPAITRLGLEFLYYLNEQGRYTQNYYTRVVQIALLFVFFMIIYGFFRGGERKLKRFGYIGMIISMVMISAFQFGYQYKWTVYNYSNIYELGNWSVTADTVLYGKLPILDYFSAHALEDVWTKIIYCMIHKDLYGVLVDPYAWLIKVLAYIVLFELLKNLFDDNYAIIYILLFPGNIIGIKWSSVCFLPILLFIFILRKPTTKRIVLFWITTLVCAFYTYDEGISIGISCIATFIFVQMVKKQWELLRRFLGIGTSIGTIAIGMSCIYLLEEKISPIARVKEWLSLSVGANTSWATANFGDQSSFAFFISYIVVPLIASLILIVSIIQYYKNKEHEELNSLIIVFAMVQILFITRTIVYHNLAVCRGYTGVLLNFIHWTVALYVLYILTKKDYSLANRWKIWMLTMFLIILLEGTMVTQQFPASNSVLAYNALTIADSWELKNGTTDNIGLDRIEIEEDSSILIGKYKSLFDYLLDDDETFLDFANVDSMYLLTGRKRPCYVSQSPSLLTNVYSQKCFIKEINNMDCPLVLIGTTETNYLSQMVGIPHNIRYYQIAEYIYEKYRPLVAFDEIAIWCDKARYEKYLKLLNDESLTNLGYSMIDYGYDFTTINQDEYSNIQYDFKPYHNFDLEKIPYIWANYDIYDAKSCKEIVTLKRSCDGIFRFAGSQFTISKNGNYLALNIENTTPEDISTNVVLFDSKNEGAKLQYQFTLIPGTNDYLIRISQDYFWDVYNIDTIVIGESDTINVNSIRILQGD